MIIGIALLVVGIFTGYLLRNRKKLIALGSRFTDGAIFMLLFFLGLSVGSNQAVVSNFNQLGLQAFLLTVLATLGSILVTQWFYRMFFKDQ